MFTLDEGAREWLADLETQLAELTTAKNAHEELQRKQKRLRKAEALRDIAELLSSSEARLQELQKKYDDEVELFFSRIFGVTRGGIVARKAGDGKLSPSLIVTNMSARLLSDGKAAFTVSGDSMTKTLINGFPDHAYLMVQEAKGETLVNCM